MMNEYRSRWERLDLIHREKFDIVLPKAMRENQVDMWIHVAKLGNPDALALDLGVGVSVRCPDPSGGSTGYFVFTDRGGDRIERAILGGSVQQGGSAYDIIGPEEDLGQFVAERDPKRIAVNMSGWLAVADGLSHTCYLRLVEALGEKYAERLVSAERVITDFRDRRVIREIVEYGQLGETTRQLIERALSNEVITPGVTTRADVGWWMKEQILARGIEPSFSRLSMPGVLHSAASEESEYRSSQYIFQRGDLLEYDWGFNFMNLGTDIKRTAYILKEGETVVPAGIQNAWDQALKACQVIRKNIKVGRTAGETLKILGSALEEAGFAYAHVTTDPGHVGWEATEFPSLKLGEHPKHPEKTDVYIDCHCVGNTGSSQIEPGPAISSFRPGRGHLTIKPNHLFAFEVYTATAVPEWGGNRVRFGIEDDAIVTEDGVQFLYPPNSRILLIG